MIAGQVVGSSYKLDKLVSTELLNHEMEYFKGYKMITDGGQ